MTTVASLLDSLREEDTIGSVRVHDVDRVGDAHRHLTSIPLGNRDQRRRGVEGPRTNFANIEAQSDARRAEVDDPTRLVRTLVVFEPAL